MSTSQPSSTASADQRLFAIAFSELVTFLAVVEHGGFTAAARRLYLSQPGVSAHIRRLETSLGVRLIDRSVRRLTLTPEGRAFLPQARVIVRELERGHREALTVAE